MDKAQPDAIAQAINEHNNELATKSDINLVRSEVKGVKELLYFVIGAGGAALGYIITKI